MATGGPVGTPWHVSCRIRRWSGRNSSQPFVIARIALRSSRTVAQVSHEVFERIERQLFVAPIDHLRGETVLVLAPGRGATLVHVRIAVGVCLVLGIAQLFPVAVSPVPVPGQEPLDRRRAAREGDVGGGHLRRHHRDEIVLADHAIERLDERLSNRVRGADVDVVGIEEEDEQPRLRLLGHRARLADRVRLHTRVLRAGGADDDALELLDGLRRAALEDLEVGLGEVRHRRTVASRRIRVDADVVGFGSKGRLWRLCRRLRRRLGKRRGGDEDGSER